MGLTNLTRKNRISMLIAAIAFIIINSLTLYLIFNTPFFSTTDKEIFSSRFVLIANGVGIGTFFIILIFLKSLSIKKLFQIFIITQIILFIFITLFHHDLEMDFRSFESIGRFVLEGKLFTPYISGLQDVWRHYPPMWMWWYTYHYFVYGMEPNIFRFINVLLGIVIVFVMIKIFEENKSEKALNEEYFKIGLLFYMFSIPPIYTFVLKATVTALPVLLGFLGFLFYFRSKTDSKNIYISIFFFCLCALTEYFGAIWIVGILLIILFQRNFKRLIFIIVEIVAIFCLISLPLMMNDAVGFMQRIFWQFTFYRDHWNGTIWAIWNEILPYIPVAVAGVLTIHYTYKIYNKPIFLDYFLVILSIFLFFSPHFTPWYFLWVFPLICIGILDSPRKFLTANALFLIYFIGFFLLFAIASLFAFGSLPTDYSYAWTLLTSSGGFMDSNGYMLILRFLIQPFYLMGFLYVVFHYTKSKTYLFVMMNLLIAFYLLKLLVFH